MDFCLFIYMNKNVDQSDTYLQGETEIFYTIINRKQQA